MTDGRDMEYANHYGTDSYGREYSCGMQDRFLERRAESMYRQLAQEGKFSEIDKAKHNENYRNFLLENFDEWS